MQQDSPDAAGRDRALRWATAYVLGCAAVAVLGVLTTWIVEATSAVAYELHWFRTMPFLALAFAYVLLKGGGRPLDARRAPDA